MAIVLRAARGQRARIRLRRRPSTIIRFARRQADAGVLLDKPRKPGEMPFLKLIIHGGYANPLRYDATPTPARPTGPTRPTAADRISGVSLRAAVQGSRTMTKAEPCRPMPTIYSARQRSPIAGGGSNAPPPRSVTSNTQIGDQADAQFLSFDQRCRRRSPAFGWFASARARPNLARRSMRSIPTRARP